MRSVLSSISVIRFSKNKVVVLWVKNSEVDTSASIWFDSLTGDFDS